MVPSISATRDACGECAVPAGESGAGSSRCALYWVFQNTEKYGFDQSKIVLTGGSADGHPVLMTGLLKPSDGFDGECSGAARGGSRRSSTAMARRIWRMDGSRKVRLSWIGWQEPETRTGGDASRR